jgi:A/G-specific adenine glycosylase
MPKSVKNLQTQLLDWFARHRRVMPWRAAKGIRPDPYHVWLSEIMLQQTTVVTVGPYFMKFIGKWPTVKHLAKAKLDDVLTAWAGLGYYARARNLHKCAVTIANDHAGKFPETIEGLLELPGIGPYTAAAIVSIAFNQPAVAVDGNVERVVSRFFAIQEPLPLSKDQIRERAAQLAKNNPHPGDFTQAFMELGATVCTPRKPKCGLCPWAGVCAARKKGLVEELPRKVEKARKPVRYGKVFYISNKRGEFLIHKRTGQGLYEGLYQLPTTEWIGNRALAKKLAAPAGFARLESLGAEVRHSFTHFDLILEIWHGHDTKNAKLAHAAWISTDNVDEYALPTLMKKAIRLCGNGNPAKIA